MGSCSSKSSSEGIPSDGIDGAMKSAADDAATASCSADAEKHSANAVGGGSAWSQLYSAGVMRVNDHYTKECECGKFYRNS